MFSLLALLICLLTITMASNPSLDKRIQDTLAAMPSKHRLPLFTGKVVDSIEAGKVKLQNYAFTQNFALVLDQKPHVELRR